MKKSFDEIFVDKTKYGTKIKSSDYHNSGHYIIVDQGQDQIAGYTDVDSGLFNDVPAIVFGDHTKIVKYVDQPFYLGADGVKVLRSKYSDVNYKYLYYALKHVRIPDTGYNRHFKWLKESQIIYPDRLLQDRIVEVLDKVVNVIDQRKKQLGLLDSMIISRFIEMFGDPINNPKNWNTVSLIKSCKSIFGCGTPSKNHPEYYDGDIPWVSPKDMKSNIISDSIDHITEDGIKNSSTRLIPEGSVLMVIRSGILKHNLPVAINTIPVTINQDMKAFITGECITSSFLICYFKAIEKDVLSGVRGVTADNIDFKVFQQREIIMPPLELQKKFELFYNHVNNSKVTIQDDIYEMELLYDSLMQQYFGL